MFLSQNDTTDCSQYRPDLDTALFIIAPPGGGFELLSETAMLANLHRGYTHNPDESLWWARASAYDAVVDADSLQLAELQNLKDSTATADYGKFCSINRALKDSLGTNVDSLIVVNTTISPQNNMEELMKYVNEIILQREKQANKQLSSEQIMDLRGYAALCPLVYGPSVYTSRALLRMHDTLRVAYMNECEKVYPASNSSRSFIQSSETESPSKFELFPNPNDGLFNIEYDSTYLAIRIIDISGKQVFDTRLNQNQHKVGLDLTHLSQGLYIYEATNTKGLRERGKIIIRK
jgi:hypothetical protein